MRIFNRLIVFFYTAIFTIIGAALIVIALHLNGTIDLSLLFDYVIEYPNLYVIVGLSGILLILVSLSLASISFKRFQKEKTIGYSTNSGQVIVSLSAIEDYIRRMSIHLPDVKELRSDVIVTRRGIEIESRVSLWSTSSIPEVTQKIQSIVKTQVQDLLTGIDKPIMVNVHVTKIAQRDQAKGKKEKEELQFMG